MSIWKFPEEKKPCGITGLQFNRDYRLWVKKPDISHILVSRPITHPWFLVLWEPLRTYAPSPATVQPYCCYIKAVVFYYRPYILDSFSRLWRSSDGKWRVTSPGYEMLQYDEIETALQWDDELIWEGETFVCGAGKVIWKNKRWWMLRWARKKRQN